MITAVLIFQAFGKPFGKLCFTQRLLAILISEKLAGFLLRFYIKPILVAFAYSSWISTAPRVSFDSKIAGPAISPQQQ
jgi:hypothetical protein